MIKPLQNLCRLLPAMFKALVSGKPVLYDKHMPSSEELQSKYQSTYNNKAGGYQYPINGHVLYLQVGSDVKGPTVVFLGQAQEAIFMAKTRFFVEKKEILVTQEMKLLQIVNKRSYK
jgi:hypothetical protein